MTKILTLAVGLFLFIEARAQTIDTIVQVDGHKLHFKIRQGQGIPILFEAGNGDDGSVWEVLLDSIHQATGTTLITYDRAGLGQSEIDTANISFQSEIENLETALKQLGYDGNVFLVSHSFGGFYASLFAYRNPDRVKGAIFIDPALPCFFTPEWSQGFIDAIKASDWSMIKQYKPGLYYVLQHLKKITAFMQDKYISPDIPLTLIAAEQLLPMVKPYETENWKSCLKDFGNAEGRKYVLATGATHKVWNERPDVVTLEVIQLYEAVK
ncbi:MAG: alpha/beta hydrolase [Bacteroidota bacterium]